MTELRRTVVLCRPDTPIREIAHLTTSYELTVVYTVFTETESPKVATLIAARHLIEHNAEILMIPHLTAAQIHNDRRWRSVLAAADIITADGPVEYPTPPHIR